MTRSGGFALVLVLWVLSLLTIMAGSFALSMRREAAVAGGNSNNAQGVALAESGLAIAELMLMNSDPQQCWRTDGSIYQVDYAEAKVRIQLLSETGKIDLNSADQTLLQALMTYAPVPAELQTKLVNAILDWRDEDDLVRLEGAEKKEYQDAGLSYQPRNKPFQSVEELQLVLGMNEQVFKWLENLVTVYSGQAKVDLTQAAKEVLLVLPGMDAELIEQYIAARRASAINGVPAPAFGAGLGDNAASRPGGSGGTLEKSAGIPANNAQGQQSAITVAAEALLDDGTTTRINVLIKKADNVGSPFQALKWQRSSGDNSLFSDAQDQLLVRQYAEPQFND